MVWSVDSFKNASSKGFHRETLTRYTFIPSTPPKTPKRTDVEDVVFEDVVFEDDVKNSLRKIHQKEPLTATEEDKITTYFSRKILAMRMDPPILDDIEETKETYKNWAKLAIRNYMQRPLDTELQYFASSLKTMSESEEELLLSSVNPLRELGKFAIANEQEKMKDIKLNLNRIIDPFGDWRDDFYAKYAPFNPENTDIDLPFPEEIEYLTFDIRYVCVMKARGRTYSYQALTMATNGRGWVGLGVGRDELDPEDATIKSKLSAVSNMFKLSLNDDLSFSQNVSLNFKRTKLFIKATRGEEHIRAPPIIAECLEMIGVRSAMVNIIKGKKNKWKYIPAFFKALSLMEPVDWKMKALGRYYNQYHYKQHPLYRLPNALTKFDNSPYTTRKIVV